MKIDKNGTPYFSVRRWQMNHLQGPFEYFHEHDQVMSMINSARYIENMIALAPEYGINGIELDGRPGEGGTDLDWLVTYDSLPNVKKKREYPDDIAQRRELYSHIIEICANSNLECWIWDHEPYFPTEFYEAYPEARGMDYPVCLSHTTAKDFVQEKYREFIEAIPSVTGFVLSLNECAGLNIITDRGCRCPRCKGIPIPEKIRILLDWILEVASPLGKEIVARTFTAANNREIGKHTEGETMRGAFSNLPEEVIIMTKTNPCDFYALGDFYNPLIGAFKNRQIMEFTLNREWIGGTNIPVLTPRDYKGLFDLAVDKGCYGVSGRIDFCNPPDQPIHTLEHPNSFNIFCFSQLSWNPQITGDKLWDAWLAQRYPDVSPENMRPVLEPTEEIASRIFNDIDNVAVNYQITIPHVWQSKNALWRITRAKWQKRMENSYKKLNHPDEEVIDEIFKEKETAVKLAKQARASLQKLKGMMDSLDFIELDHGLDKSAEAAEFWKWITQVFYLSIMSKQTDGDRLVDITERLYTSACRLLEQMQRIRNRFCKNAWPTVPIGFRGIITEEFVCEIFRREIYRLMKKEEPFYITNTYVDSNTIALIYPRGGVEYLYRVLMDVAQPDEVLPGGVKKVAMHITEPLRQVSFNERCMIVSSDERNIKLPLLYHIDSPTIEAGSYSLEISQPEQGLLINVINSKYRT